jgi:flavin reductase (DIM6/NTAB) family NADH-FMN oxidoreductase RutF
MKELDVKTKLFNKVSFNPSKPVLAQFISLSPITLVTTVCSKGKPDVAAKTQSLPVGREGNLFLFVCTPEHHTYRNVKATKEFVVNYPSQEIIGKIGATASIFGDENMDKISRIGLTAIPSMKVKPPRIAECVIHLECKLVEIRDHAQYGIIIGHVVAASGNEETVLTQGSATELINKNLSKNPLLAYITPSQHFNTITECKKFPLPEKYKS